MNIVLQRDSGQYFYSRIKLALNFRMKKKKLQIQKKNPNRNCFWRMK